MNTTDTDEVIVINLRHLDLRADWVDRIEQAFVQNAELQDYVARLERQLEDAEDRILDARLEARAEMERDGEHDK